ncbi:apolipo protein O-domain-containing protein [Infundibulicybe gibba]|nr:apolipo protein O-domain-containing protein [Infundibulicybe gibba]
MFRAQLRLPRRTLFSAAALGAVGLQEDFERPREKLSIYPSPTPDIVLLETPSPLEQQIGVARRRVMQAYGDAHTQVQGVVSRWIGVEHAVEDRVKSLIAPNESLTPGLLFVGIATLSGSILARSRMLPTRLLLPPAFFLISLNQFLPRTSANIAAYMAELEERHFPVLAQKHDVANAHTRMTWERIKEGTSDAKEWVDRGAGSAVDKIQEATGLKLRETFGLGAVQAAAKRVEAKAVEVVKAVEHKVEDGISEVVKPKLEEVKAEVVKPKLEEAKAVVEPSEPAPQSEPAKKLV